MHWSDPKKQHFLTSSLCCLPLDGVRTAAMTKNCHNDYKMKFSLDDEFPDLSLHNNHMAKVQQHTSNMLLWAQ